MKQDHHRLHWTTRLKITLCVCISAFLFCWLLFGCSVFRKNKTEQKTSVDSTVLMRSDSISITRKDSTGSKTTSESKEGTIEIEFDNGGVIRTPFDSAAYAGKPFPISRISYRKDGSVDISGPIKSIKASGRVVRDTRDSSARKEDITARQAKDEKKKVKTEEKKKDVDVKRTGMPLVQKILIAVGGLLLLLIVLAVIFRKQIARFISPVKIMPPL